MTRYLVSAFVGLAAGLCATTALVWGFGSGSGSSSGSGFLMSVSPVPDPGWAGSWAQELVPAATAQEVALNGLMEVLAAAFLLAAAAAVVCGVLLLAEERIAATRSVAIRSALGIDRWRLAVELGRGVGVRGRNAGMVALTVALSCGFVIRWTWPDQVHGWTPLDAVLAFGAGLVATGIVIATTVIPGLAIWRRTRLFAYLSRQSPTLPDRGESFGRDIAVVCQVAVAVSVLVVIGGFVGSSPDRPGLDTLGEDTIAIPMEIATATPEPSRAGLYETLLAGFAAGPDVEAESIATPGALLALGGNGIVVSQCGQCSIGGFPVPIMTLLADHHAVGPGFFGVVGYEIVRGREFTAADGSESGPVVIVNKSFADRYFERGNPIGRGVQVGGSRGEWFNVVGVVQEPRAVAMGAQSSQRPALYLSLLQVPPARSTLVARSSASSSVVEQGSSSEADLERLAALIPPSVTSGPPTTVAAVRRMSWAPLSWLRWTLLALASIALLVVVAAVRAVMRVSVERSAAEIGLRMAVGATPARIGALVIGRALRRLVWGIFVGLFFGLLLLGRLERVIPEVSTPPMQWVLAWTSFLSIVAVWGAWKPARQAAGQDPARVLAEG